MNLTKKKYFSISEVSEITGIPQHKLRYLDKSNSKTEIFQVRGRRYYTALDIQNIKQKFNCSENSLPINTKQNSDIINRIDSLITKFIKLGKNCSISDAI